jgi:hypothetical protein
VPQNMTPLLKELDRLRAENRRLLDLISEAQTLLWKAEVKTGEGLVGLAKQKLESALNHCPPEPLSTDEGACL